MLLENRKRPARQSWKEAVIMIMAKHSDRKGATIEQGATIWKIQVRKRAASSISLVAA